MARRRTGTLVSLALGVLMGAAVVGSLVGSPRADAATTHTISLVGAGDAAADLPLDGQTFDAIVRDLRRNTTPTIPLALPGFETIADIPVALTTDSTNNVVALATESPLALLDGDSTLAGVPVDLLLTAQWDDANHDAVPQIALGLRAADQLLSDLYPAWDAGALPGLPDVATFTDAILTFAPGLTTLDPGTLPDVVKDFYGLDGALDETIVLDAVSGLLAELDLSAMPTVDEVAEFLGIDPAEIPSIIGELAQTAAQLFDEDAAVDETEFSLDGPFEIDSSQLPDWLVRGAQDAGIPLPTFELRIGPAPDRDPSFEVHDVAEVTLPGGAGEADVTNTVDYRVSLQEASDLDVHAAVPDFEAPFGLGWMDLENVDLRLFARESGPVGGAFEADVPMGAATPHVAISTEVAPGASSATVAVTGPVSVADVVDWLSTTDAFSTDGFDPEAVEDTTLDAFEFFYDDSSNRRLLAAFADGSASIPTPDFVATPDALDVTAFLGVSDPDADGPSEPVFVGALRATDPDCPASESDPDCIHLSGFLPFPSGSLAGDLVLPAIDAAIVQPSGATFDPTGLGTEATDFLTDALGTDTTAPFAIAGNLALHARLPVEPIEPALVAAGVALAEDTVDLRATIDVTLADFVDGHVSQLDVSAEFGDVTLGLPAGLDDWFGDVFDWPTTGTWALTAHYDDGDDAADPADDTAALELTILDVTTNLPVELPEFDVTARVERDFTDGDALVVTLRGEMGEWDEPFGVPFVDVDEATLEVVIRIGGAHPGTTVSIDGLLTIGDGPSATQLALSLTINAVTDDGGELEFDATIEVSLLDSVSVADLIDLLGIDPAAHGVDVPESVLEASFGPGMLTIAIDGDGIAVDAVIETSFAPFGDPIVISTLLSAQIGENERLTIGARPVSEISLGDLLPIDLPEIQISEGEPPVPLDFVIVDPDGGANFGFLFSTAPLPLGNGPDALSDTVRTWLLPLYGEDPDTGAFPEFPSAELATGVSALGNFALPEPLDQIVGFLGIEPEVQLTGTVPLPLAPGEAPDLGTFGVALAVNVDPDVLPYWLGGAGLSFELSASAPDFSLTVQASGALTVLFPQGFDPALAGPGTPLADVGLPVQETFASEPASCPRGGTAREVDSIGWQCFDPLTVSITGGLTASVGPPPSLELFVTGAVTSAGDVWNPFGLEFVGLREATLDFGLNFTPGPTPVSATVGISGSVDILTKNYAGAVQVGIAPLPATPFFTVTFGGLRVSALDGLFVSDLVDLYDLVADLSEDDPIAPIPAAALDQVPNMGVRNLKFSISPLGVDRLCIEQGLIFSADFYLNATEDLDSQAESCKNGRLVRDNPDLRCPELADIGCFAGVFGSFTPAGIVANGFVNSIDIGPVHTDATILDFLLSPTDILGSHLILQGGITIDMIGTPDPDDVFGRGFARLELYPTTIDVFAELELFELFEAYVELSGSLLPPEPGFEVTAVFRSDGSFADDVAAAVADLLEPLADKAEVVALAFTALTNPSDSIALDALESLDARDDIAISGLPSSSVDLTFSDRLRGALAAAQAFGVDAGYLDWLTGGFLDWMDTIEDLTGDTFEEVFDFVLGSTCVLVLDPDVDGDGRGDVSGTACSLATVRSDVGNALAGLFPTGGTPGDDLETQVQSLLGGGGISLPCAAFHAELAGLSASVSLEAHVSAFGEDYYPAISWAFEPSLPNVDDIFDWIVAAIFDGAGAGSAGLCDGPDPDLTIAPASGMFVVLADDLVFEGESVSVEGSFVPPADADAVPTVTVDWGDGSSTGATESPAGFSAAHVYGDDGMYTITISSSASATDEVLEVEVRNDLPVVDDLTMPGPVAEGDVVTVDPVGLDDPGADDTHTAFVVWDDGTLAEAATIGAGGDTVELPTHRYADDGTYDITVCVTDDDGGIGCSTTDVTILNASPILTAPPSVGGVFEGDAVSIADASFSDAGSLDTHAVLVDWGDGSPVQTAAVSESPTGPPGSPTGVAGTATFPAHVYADNDTYDVEVCARDDDATVAADVGDAAENGWACGMLTITVANVLPSIDAGADQTVFEGDDAMLDPATFSDPGTLDTHTATVDWSDGGGAEPATVTETPFGPPGSVLGMSGTIHASHAYGDDAEVVVTVAVADDDEPGTPVGDTFAVTVLNAPPVVDAGADQSVDEGDVVSLAPSSFTDPGVLDTHTATVDWGDGTGVAAATVTQATRTVDASHTYADDGDYTVTVCVTDDELASDCDDLVVHAANVAPSGVTVDTVGDGPAFFLPLVSMPLTGSFHDQGTADTHTASVSWGDGTSSPALVFESPFGPPGDAAGADGTVAAAHAYGAPGTYDVVLTVVDDDTGTTDSSAWSVEVVSAEEALARVVDSLVALEDAATTPAGAAAIAEALKDLDGSLGGTPNSGAIDKLEDGDRPAAVQKLAEALMDLADAAAAEPALDLRDDALLLTQVAESIAAQLAAEADAAIDPTSQGAVRQVADAYALLDDARTTRADALATYDGGDVAGGFAGFVDAVETFHEVARRAERLI